jgi:hypothetical protein
VRDLSVIHSSMSGDETHETSNPRPALRLFDAAGGDGPR